MAVFVAFADETDCGVDHRGRFFYCGWIAPELEWSQTFTPLWDSRVLKGPPRIEYLHMTEIRSRSWRDENGIDKDEADFRIDQAFSVITAMPILAPIACEFNGGHMKDTFEAKMKFKSGAIDRYEPDYLAFYGFVDASLQWVIDHHPEAEKVDFVVERKTKITNRIQEFHESLPEALRAIGHPERARLVGELIPAGKERRPLHAADLLCWYTRRAHERNLEPKDIKRYAKIASRIGNRIPLSDDMLEQLYLACLPETDNEQSIEGIPSVRRADGETAGGSAQRDQSQAGRGESGEGSEKAED